MDRQRRAGLLFVLPALLYFTAVFLIPLGESVLGSFYRTRPGEAASSSASGSTKRPDRSQFWQAIRNTVNSCSCRRPPRWCWRRGAGARRFARLSWRSMGVLTPAFAVSLVAAARVAVAPSRCTASSITFRRIGIGPQVALSSLERCRPGAHHRYPFDTVIFLAALQAIRGSTGRPPSTARRLAELGGTRSLNPRLRWSRSPSAVQLVGTCGYQSRAASQTGGDLLSDTAFALPAPRTRR